MGRLLGCYPNYLSYCPERSTVVSESHQVAGVAVVGHPVGNLWKNRRSGRAQHCN